MPSRRCRQTATNLIDPGGRYPTIRVPLCRPDSHEQLATASAAGRGSGKSVPRPRASDLASGPCWRGSVLCSVLCRTFQVSRAGARSSWARCWRCFTGPTQGLITSRRRIGSGDTMSGRRRRGGPRSRRRSDGVRRSPASACQAAQTSRLRPRPCCGSGAPSTASERSAKVGHAIVLRGS